MGHAAHNASTPVHADIVTEAKMVLLAGLEPARLAASDFKSGVSAHSTTEAKMVPLAGVEPARLSATVSETAVSAIPPQGPNWPPRQDSNLWPSGS